MSVHVYGITFLTVISFHTCALITHWVQALAKTGCVDTVYVVECSPQKIELSD
uniref:Uncharacterized protein n=1 Tax=Sinocyclocheilus grahami TaxID=75366 RepID=A0A672QU84_SINGR